MLKNIITYLNLKLDLLNYFDLTRCLSELKGDNEGKIYPVEYISDGNYERIDFDNFDGVSYWRLRDEITSDRLTNIYKAGKRIEVTVPLRLVFSVRRSKLTTDDAYAFDRIRQTIVKQFNIDDGTLKSSLLAEKVIITSPSANGDAKEVWDSETDNTGTFEPRLDFVYGSVDVDVVVTYKGDCMPTECDDVDSDILHTFNFCLPTVQSRLTPTQVDCLRTWLAGSCDPVTVQVNSTTVGTPASGDTYNVTIQNSQLNAVGDNANPCTIGDSQMTVHGSNVDTVPAEQTYDFRVKDSAGTNIGTSSNPSIVSDSTITVNSSSLGATGNVVAEGSLDITVNLDGSPSGSWNGTSWEVTSVPCDYGTRIGSLLRRQYCVEAMCSFGFDVLEDEFVGESSVMLRRDADGVTANYTQTEYEDGVTVEAWLAAGGGTENAAVVVMYDNTGNYFELYNNTANNQALMFIAGVRQVDSNGNTCMVTQNTQGYFIGALGANAQDLPLFTTNGSMWTVAERGTQSGVSRQITASGNPTVGIAQSGSTSSATLSSGSPQYYVNNAALANNQRGELHAATENVRALTFIETIDFSFSGSWRTNSQINVFNAYPVGSKIHEVVIGKKDWGTSTIRNLIYTNRNAYYNF